MSGVEEVFKLLVIAGCLWGAYKVGISIVRDGVDGGFDVVICIVLVMFAAAAFKGMYWPNPGGAKDRFCQDYGPYGVEVCR